MAYSAATNVAHAIITIPEGSIPTASQMNTLAANMYSAARSMTSNRGGGILGHVGAIMPPAEYNARPGTVPWIDPVDPGHQPVMPVPAPTAAATSVILRQFDADVREFSGFITNLNVFRALLVDNVDNTLFGHLHDPLLGYSNVHPRTILQHLLTTYGEVTADELEANLVALRAPWDPSQPIVGLWSRQTELQLFSVGHDDITWPTVVRTTVGILEAMGTYPDTIREWRMRAPAQHTWPALMAAFNHADKEYRRQATVSTQHYANLARVTQPGTTTPAVPHPWYCFTHGVTWQADHTSLLCDYKCEGHKDAATLTNMMGGNNTIRRLPGQPPHPAAQPRSRRRGNRTGRAPGAPGAPAPP